MLPFPTINWRTIPMVRLLLPFMVGILFWNWFEASPSFNLLLIISFAIALAIAVLNWQKLSRRWLSGIGLGIFSLFCLLGYARSLQHQQNLQRSHFANQLFYSADSIYQWSGRLIDIKATAERWQLVVELKEMVTSAKKTIPVSGQLQVFVAGSEHTSTLLPGNKIIFEGKAQPIAGPKNPAVFDAASFYSKKNIYHRTYVEDQRWDQVGHSPSIYGYAYQTRAYLLTVLRTYLPSNSKELAVAAALILGKRDELSTDLRNAYAETGAVHVLAVSGLHIGFVTIGLGWLLGWLLRGYSWGRWLQFVLVLAGTWAFAFVTGLAPSVLRAAVMLSALEIGKVMGRKSSTYNALALSAFLLLFYDPYLLFNIGFQLSYLAVLGIVFFQDHFYRTLYFANPVLDKVWSLTTVALAAQLATLPLSLYYFHQFPIYFLLTGILVVILAQFVLGFGIALFIANAILPILTSCFGWLLFWSLNIMNGVVSWVRALPGHLIQGIWITEWILILLGLSILTFAFFVAERQKSWIWGTMALLFVSLASYSWNQVNNGQQRKIIVYHQYKGSILDAFDGHERITISNLPENDERMQWTTLPFRQQSQVQLTVDSPHWLSVPPIHGFYDQKIAIIDSGFTPNSMPDQPIEVDILLLQSSPKYQLSDLQQYFAPNHWVIDGSNYPSYAKRWMKQAQTLGLSSVHYTAQDGAFILEF